MKKPVFIFSIIISVISVYILLYRPALPITNIESSDLAIIGLLAALLLNICADIYSNGKKQSSNKYLIPSDSLVNNRFMGNPDIVYELNKMIKGIEEKKIPHQICLIKNPSAEESYRSFVSVCNNHHLSHYYIDASMSNLNDIMNLTSSEEYSIIYVEGNGLTVNDATRIMNIYTRATIIISVVGDIGPEIMKIIHPTLYIKSSKPKIDDRLKTISEYIKKLNHSSSINIDSLARYTKGYTYLDLYNLMRNALAISRMNGEDSKVSPDDFDKAYMEYCNVDIGISDIENSILSINTAGYAFTTMALNNSSEKTFPLIFDAADISQVDQYFPAEIIDQIKVLLSGYCAEKVFFKTVSKISFTNKQKAIKLMEDLLISHFNLNCNILSDQLKYQLEINTKEAITKLENNIISFMQNNIDLMNTAIDNLNDSEYIDEELVQTIKQSFNPKDIELLNEDILNDINFNPVLSQPVSNSYQSPTLAAPSQSTNTNSTKNKPNTKSESAIETKQKSNLKETVTKKPSEGKDSNSGQNNQTKKNDKKPSATKETSKSKGKKESQDIPDIPDLEDIPMPDDNIPEDMPEDEFLFDNSQQFEIPEPTDMEIPEPPQQEIDLPSSSPIQQEKNEAPNSTTHVHNQKKEIENLLNMANTKKKKQPTEDDY